MTKYYVNAHYYEGESKTRIRYWRLGRPRDEQ